MDDAQQPSLEPGDDVPVRRPARVPSRTRLVTPARQARRSALPFAIVGVVLALAAGGLALYTSRGEPDRRTPDAVVNEFLSAVFPQSDPERVAKTVCSSWDPAVAIAFTTSQIDPRARLSWSNVSVLDASDGRATVVVRLQYSFDGATAGSAHRQWRFRLVDESGWRVCDARPLGE